MGLRVRRVHPARRLLDQRADDRGGSRFSCRASRRQRAPWTSTSYARIRSWPRECGSTTRLAQTSIKARPDHGNTSPCRLRGRTVLPKCAPAVGATRDCLQPPALAQAVNQRTPGSSTPICLAYREHRRPHYFTREPRESGTVGCASRNRATNPPQTLSLTSRQTTGTWME